jgi:hypothetical protein
MADTATLTGLADSSNLMPKNSGERMQLKDSGWTAWNPRTTVQVHVEISLHVFPWLSACDGGKTPASSFIGRRLRRKQCEEPMIDEATTAKGRNACPKLYYARFPIGAAKQWAQSGQDCH